MARDVFVHGVASGDALVDRVVIWTRVSGAGASDVPVTWRVCQDGALQSVVAEGVVEATAETDHTVKIDVEGLEPATTYWYGFDAEGARSTTGRTRTLPAQPDRLRFAYVSCAKYNAGFFNAYSRIAERDDLDFVLHLGDYIYEAAQNPPASQTPAADIGRAVDPLHECRTLADYRKRYAHYRLDPDVQALHAAHPMTSTTDDHEFADGAWKGGSVEHRPERDGPWEDRLATCVRARTEWLPVRVPHPEDPLRLFRRVQYGGLADLFLLDTRTRRDEPAGGAALADPRRSLLGREQREWLFDGLARSRARWRLVGNPSVMGPTWSPALPADVVPALAEVKLIAGEGPDPDQWDGYPLEREALWQHLRDERIEGVVVFSGDVHVGLALEHRPRRGAEAVAVEFVTASLTSQNVDDKMQWAPRTRSLDVERSLMAAMPHVRWCDLDSHGYAVADVTRDRVAVEWWFVDTVLERTTGERRGAAWAVRHGSPRLVDVGAV